MTKATTTHDLVFELGIEELPSPYFDCVYSQSSKVEDFVSSAGLTFESLSIYITPRRIVFFLANLCDRQAEKEELIKGPAYDKSFDADGKPTRALSGFLSSKGVSEQDIFEHEGRVAIKRMSGGSRTDEVLQALLPDMLKLFTFPRNMGWNDSGVRFPRPIRWLVCLYGKKVIPVELAGLVASNVTRGHCYIAPGAITVADTTDYFAQLEAHKITMNEDERVAAITDSLASFAETKGFTSAFFDKSLIRTIARLCERPFLISGSFKEEYLSLPADVLATCMKKHQKIFACYDHEKTLVNTFVAVLDGERSDVSLIQKGYENVLESRLKDAAFFVGQDRKHKDDTKEENGRDTRLKDVTFLKGLGTVYDKVARLHAVATAIGKTVRFDGVDTLSAEEQGYLCRGANHCKNDLLTSLVYEFPELQGIAGREYLKMDGVPEAVSRAVSDHYLPKALSDTVTVDSYADISVGRISALLSIIDRLDTIVGALGIGITISGSEDPYALRRASGGIIKLIRAFNIQISLTELLSQVIAAYEAVASEHCRLTVERESLVAAVRTLLKERIIFEANEPSGSLHKMILDAVVASKSDDICDVFVRLAVLKDLAAEQPTVFKNVCRVVERTGNISKAFAGDVSADVQQSLLQDPVEVELHTTYLTEGAAISEGIAGKDYMHATVLYADIFCDIVHRFFEEVLVNVDDEAVKNNRLLLLKQINRLVTEDIADLSLVHGLE